MSEIYRPQVGPGSNPESTNESKEYIPQVGPGSKSVSPTGNFKELPVGLLLQISNVNEA